MWDSGKLELLPMAETWGNWNTYYIKSFDNVFFLTFYFPPLRYILHEDNNDVNFKILCTFSFPDSCRGFVKKLPFSSSENL